MERYINKWKQLLNNVKERIENDRIEEQELSGNIIENSASRIILAEVCDISRIRFDYGIRLKNDNLVKVKSELLIIDDNGILYYLDKQQNEELEVGNVEDYLYEYDVYKQEWKKADIITILTNANFKVKSKNLQEVEKNIIENRNMDFYSGISNNRLKLGGMIYNEQ